jgi:hypothetical protein
LGFGVWGLGFGVWGLGFGVWGLGFGVWGLGIRRSNFFHMVARSGLTMRISDGMGSYTALGVVTDRYLRARTSNHDLLKTFQWIFCHCGADVGSFGLIIWNRAFS